jgi:uncharacterized protein
MMPQKDEIRILVLGDLHGDLRKALDLVDSLKPAALLSPGDWGDPDDLPREEWQALLRRVPVYSAFGNHDDVDLLRASRNRDGSPVLLESGSRVQVLGRTATAINGIWAKSHRMPYYVTDADVDAMVAAVEAPVDILLSHGCPLGVVDLMASNRHGGQRCFNRAVEALRPRLYVCGHLHRRQKYITRDGALYLNCGDGRKGEHWLVEMTDDGFAIT